jgi:predicted RNase H-like nuclease (RuvC/YqgF family)
MTGDATNELLAIERAIGALQARSDERREDMRRLAATVSEIKEDTSRIRSLERRLANLEPDVESWKKARTRGIALISGIALGGGGIGAGVTKWLHHLLDKN